MSPKYLLLSPIDWVHFCLTALPSDERGQGLVEYGLLIFLASIIVLAILILLGPQTGSIFSMISTAI